MSGFADFLQLLFGDRLPIHRATTPHISGLYPMLTESGIIDPRTGRKVPGLPVGYAGRERTGGMFFYDPITWYQAGITSNTNTVVLGKIGARKSTRVKCEIHRGSALGYRHLVTDRKGEYNLLADDIEGSKVLRFGGNTKLFVNVHDPSMDMPTQHELVASLGRTALVDRDVLNVVEHTLLWEAIRAAHENPHGPVPLMPDTVHYLFEPTDNMVQAMHKTRQEVQDQGYQLALALQRYTRGDLQGMFHHPTTPGLLTNAPLIVFNLEKLEEAAAVAMIIVLNFFTQSDWGRRDSSVRIHKVFHDEAWDLARYPAFVDSIRRAFKLSGTWGVANTVVAHHKANFDRAGNPAILDLIADSDITQSYVQDDAELKATAPELGLTDAEVARIPELKEGVSIWKIGDLPGIEVEQEVWPEERPLVETRHKLKGELADV